MLGYFFVIHLLSSAQWPITEANKCVECASTNLKGRWGLTGFAQLFRSYSFTSTCATGADMEHYVRCSGYCMTYLFQNPDTVGTSDVELMVVRGCHQRLLGIQSVPLNNQTPNGSYCEYDKDLRRLDSQGNEVYIKALVEFCAGLYNFICKILITSVHKLITIQQEAIPIESVIIATQWKKIVIIIKNIAARNFVPKPLSVFTETVYMQYIKHALISVYLQSEMVVRPLT
uniref:Secreted protein n=1 Tax=Setaria digitata TaxID=48799 RepID=A0A915Q524_9BILA